VSTQQLEQIVARVFGISAEQVSGGLGRQSLADWTSLRHLQLIAAVEDAFSVRFTPQEIRAVRTVGEIEGIVRAKTGGC
jgi:acyl carrier protein